MGQVPYWDLNRRDPMGGSVGSTIAALSLVTLGNRLRLAPTVLSERDRPKILDFPKGGARVAAHEELCRSARRGCKPPQLRVRCRYRTRLAASPLLPRSQSDG